MGKYFGGTVHGGGHCGHGGHDGLARPVCHAMPHGKGLPGTGGAVETLRLWEEKDDGQILGLTGLAGWRVESRQAVASVSTGRQQRSQVMAVYGSMELVMAAEILSGRCGLDVEGDYCVLSRGLANSLFGSVDVAGECVKMEEKRYIVAGVVDGESDILMIPTQDGEMDHIAASFASRMAAEEKMRQVMEGVGVY